MKTTELTFKLTLKSTLGACTAAILLAVSGAQAQSAEEALASRFRAAEALIDARLTKESVPGAAIGLVHDQGLIWSHQFGVESLETKAAITDDTLFSICSVSKLFTGVAAMNLVEENRIRLDAPISEYLDGTVLPGETGAEEAVSVRNILSHVAGLPREGINDYWADKSFPDTAGLRTTIAEQTQLYKPYDHWQYSNLGMAMLGEAVAQASDTSWGDYVDKTILSPLGMNTTTLDMPFEQVGAGFAQGYYVRTPQGARKAVEPHLFRAFAPAAGVASSISDMAKFAAWNFRLRAAGGEEILKATTLQQMQRVHWVGEDFNEPAWGLAYATRRYGEETVWGHGGYCPGARTEFVMRMPSKIALVMMTSANDVSPGDFVKTVYALTSDAIKAVHGEDAKTADSDKPKDPKDTKEAKVKLADYEGYYAVENYDWDSYVGLNEDGLFVLGIFDDETVENMAKLVHEAGDRFRRQRKDGSLAEAVNFERDKAGKVSAYVQHSYRSFKR